MDDARPTLVYAHDPLCGWCYGFGPALAEARRRLDGQVRFRIAGGGLVAGNRVAPIGHWAAYIRDGLRTVAAATGTSPTGDGLERLLADGTWTYQSEPAVAAIHAASTIDPDRAVDLATAMTSALFDDGLRIDDPDVLAELATGAGYDGAALVAAWQADGARERARAWMRSWRDLGITTYPSLWATVDGHFVELAAGAISVDDVVALAARVDVGSRIPEVTS